MDASEILMRAEAYDAPLTALAAADKARELSQTAGEAVLRLRLGEVPGFDAAELALVREFFK